MSSYVAWRGPSELDGAPIVAIVVLDSENRKTGPMAQLFIMRADIAPHHALRTGADASVCGDCPFRPIVACETGITPCYVLVWQGPRSTWVANRDTPADMRLTCKRLAGATLRHGAYGDPAALPGHVIRALTDAVEGRITGYTHQWRDPRFAFLKNYVMASCDAPTDYARAKAEGWRTFRVIPKKSLPVLARKEILCPSAKVECIDCRLCDGIQYQRDNRKDIAIVAHN
jgi:hypothetical protein